MITRIVITGLVTALFWSAPTFSKLPSERSKSLIAGLAEGELKNKLASCVSNELTASVFSIAHRGAPVEYPEHTREGYVAAAEMGAGIIECDVTFTKDRELVCRHSQCDLHTTTNILATPLAEKCSSPPDLTSSAPFKNVKCCTSDITLQEFKTLQGKMDVGNKDAKTVEEYLATVPRFKSELYSGPATLMSHAESVELFQSLGVKMTPELKAPQVTMPFAGDYTQQAYAQALVKDYVAAGVEAKDVFLQSFNLEDVSYWIDKHPEFGRQAVWLDGRYRDKKFKIGKPKSWSPSMQELAGSGVNYLAPPLWMLLSTDSNNQLIASSYATAATQAGLNLIAWTLERSGPLSGGGGWYYQTVKPAIDSDSDVFEVLDALAMKVKIKGVFSDWPESTTVYANCMGL